MSTKSNHSKSNCGIPYAIRSYSRSMDESAPVQAFHRVGGLTAEAFQAYVTRGGENVMFVAIFALMVIFLSTRYRRKNQNERYPPYLLGPSIENNEQLGLLTTLSVIAGSVPHLFTYRCLQRISLSQQWVARLNMQLTKRAKMRFVVGDADLAREILRNKTSVKSPGYSYEFNMITNGYCSILASNGIRWKHSRKSLARAFSPYHIKRVNKVCEEKLAFWIEGTLEPLAESGGSFDVASEMLSLMISIICEAMFEYRMSPEEKNKFIDNVGIAVSEYIFINPLYKHFGFLFPKAWRAKAAAKVLMGLSLKIIDNYRAKNYKANRDLKEETIISCIVNNSNYKSDEERAADVTIILLAGHDTTAYTIAWALLEVSRNKPSELLAYREQLIDLPSEEWKGVDELQYIIKESMRLNPTIAITARMIGKDYVVKNAVSDAQVILPKGAICFIHLYSIFRHPKYYTNPDKFLPSRWAPSMQQEKTNLMKSVHTPFAVGYRNCMGQAVATGVIQTILSTLLARYDFQIEDEGSVDYCLSLKPVGMQLIPHKLSSKTALKQP